MERARAGHIIRGQNDFLRKVTLPDLLGKPSVEQDAFDLGVLLYESGYAGGRGRRNVMVAGARTNAGVEHVPKRDFVPAAKGGLFLPVFERRPFRLEGLGNQSPELVLLVRVVFPFFESRAARERTENQNFGIRKTTGGRPLSFMNRNFKGAGANSRGCPGYGGKRLLMHDLFEIFQHGFDGPQGNGK